MKSLCVVIHFNVIYNCSGCFIECEMPDIRHLTFECSPKTLDRLVIVRCAGTGHTLSEAVVFYQFLCPFGCILTAAITMEYGSVGADGISSYSHFQRILYYPLCLIFCYAPPYDPSGRYIYYSADKDLCSQAFQFRYV